MGEVLMQPMGGGIGSDDVTAAKAHVLAGHNTVTTDSDDEVVEGTMPNNAAWSASTSGSGSVTIPVGYHNGSGAVSGSASYSQGVTDADNRVNTSSASYNRGYTNGHNDGYNSGKTDGYNSGLTSGSGGSDVTISFPHPGDYLLALRGNTYIFYPGGAAAWGYLHQV